MYGTPEGLRAAVKDDMLNTIVGHDYITDPEERENLLRPLLVQALEDAAAEIDGYLSKRYPLPLTVVPAVIDKYARDIAIYNLVSRIGVGVSDSQREDNYRERYKYAIKFLELVAKGSLELGVFHPTEQAAAGFQMHGPSRVFSRDTLKGM